MNYIRRIQEHIANNSIRSNLLGLYFLILLAMVLLFAIMIFYSIDLNFSYNKIMLNIENYNQVYNKVNSLDKDIFLNITEQKSFDKGYYNQTISDINRTLNQIEDNFEKSYNFEAVAMVNLIKRTVKTLEIDINYVDELISKDSNYPERLQQLQEITHIKEMIKDNILSLTEINLAQSQKHINDVKNYYNTALVLIILLFVLTVVLSVYFLLYVIKDTVNKIHIVSEYSNRLADGDLSEDCIEFSNLNEFHVLAKAFNKMKNNLITSINKLSSSEMRITSIINAINDCIISTDSQGKIESCNNAVEKMLGYKQENLLGQNIQNIIKEINFSNYSYEKFNQQVLIKNVKVIDNKYQLEAKKEDGAMLPVEVSYNEVEFEGQRLITFIIHNVTEHKKVEKLKDEFISIVSHELRTPLTSIKGAIKLCSAGVVGSLPQKMSELLIIADNNCTRLSELINDILDLEKIKAGKMTFNMKNYDVVPIVEEAIEASNEYAKQHGVEYHMTNLIDKATINVDKNRLIQVLLNLLSNAAKFSNKNSQVNIEVLKTPQEKIRIVVGDKGIGIPEEFRSRIYNNFSQADSSDSRKKGGTGLGLSISKEIVNVMGGEIDFESELGKGTRFFVDFPEVL